MPLYEYKCQKCGHRYEVIQSISAPEIQKCPKCGGKAVRQLTPPAIQFKGSGWYVTDYAGKGTAPTPDSSGGDSAAAAKESSPEEKSAKATGGKESSKKSKKR